jgi:hypothetical protein
MTTQNRAIVDKLLTNVSRKYIPEGYISEMVLPVNQVKQTSGKVGYYGKEYLRIESSLVGGTTPYPRVTSTVRSHDSYLIEKHGLSDLITEEDFDNVEQPFDARRDTTEDLTHKLWLEKEKALADSLGSTSVVTQNTTLSGTSQYNDYTNSDPIGDFNTAMNTVLAASGVLPNLAVMNWQVARVLRYHPDLTQLVRNTRNTANGLTNEELAVALGVERVLIGIVSYNTAKEGQTDSLSLIWGKNITFLVSPKRPGKKQVTFGYRMQRKNPRRVSKNIPGNPPGAEEIMVDDSYQWLIVDTTAAYLIKDAIA